jgi:hypothetical protein
MYACRLLPSLLLLLLLPIELVLWLLLLLLLLLLPLLLLLLANRVVQCFMLLWQQGWLLLLKGAGLWQLQLQSMLLLRCNRGVCASAGPECCVLLH